MVAYDFYAGCACLSIGIVLRMIRETRGVELEDMPG
jgi:hypothetical protein